MCGICGIYDPTHRLDPEVLKDDVRHMSEEFAYRGPDGEGELFDSQRGVGLGHRRLSIIDLAGGQQPITNTSGSISLVFNGEIYNYRSEREHLEQQGITFRTQSDTEVLLALYEKYGDDAWPRLRGQFAVGIWDTRKSEFRLVRDRIGEKPLFYSIRNGVLYFASELKALLRCAGASRALDRSVFGMYFLTTHVPAPRSLVDNIWKLPGGHFLTMSPKGHELKSYWSPRTWPLTRTERNDAVGLFENAFTEAVRMCTVSDVPIGTYLSGGLDSTSVTWAVSKILPHSFHSFAIFNREGYDQHPDWKYAQLAASHLGTQHHNVMYTLSELMGLIPEYIEKSDEPFGGPTNLVSYLLAKNARAYVKVVLTGNGADELLGGYQHYYRRVFRFQNMWQWADRLIPRPLLKHTGTVLGLVHPKLKRLGSPAQTRRMDATIDYSRDWFSALCPGLEDLTRQRLSESVEVHHSLAQKNYAKRFLLEDLLVYHQHSITTMPDTTGMACSLEARNPFLDKNLVDLIFSMPPDMLIRRGLDNKFVLLKAMQGKLPNDILTRPKYGFSGMTGDQIVRWIRSEGRKIFRDTLLDSELAKDGYCSQAALANLWRCYDEAPTTAQAIHFQIPMWLTVMLELWYRRHVVARG